jgi:hypothetical protein
VDTLKKYGNFFSLSHPFKGIVSTTFMEIIQNIRRVPKIIEIHRDPIFIGNFWTKSFSCLGTQLDQISSYHPQSNGKIEFVNKFLEEYIHFFAYDK